MQEFNQLMDRWSPASIDLNLISQSFHTWYGSWVVWLHWSTSRKIQTQLFDLWIFAKFQWMFLKVFVQWSKVCLNGRI